jgi:2-dehydropantoate 2-reductase
MRAPLGDIVSSPGGGDLIRDLFEECRIVAESAGFAPSAAFHAQALAALTAAGSPLTASMLRDIEGNAPIEADHIIGDLLRRRSKADTERGGRSLLAIAYIHLKAYEARRKATRAP